MASIAPPFLRTGDAIAIIPTARAIDHEELRNGIALAESWGLKGTLGEGIGRKHFQQAGTDRERAEDLQRAIDDPKIRAIWCARGGYGTVRLMDLIDLGPLRQDPKWIVGFSDITVLHNAMHGLGIQSMHAQMPFNIGTKTVACIEGLRRALFGENADISFSHSSTKHPPRPGACVGVVVGGNLSMLYSLRGTPFDIDPSGKILFLEDLDELLYHVDRMVNNLRLGGWFQRPAGVIVGGMSDMRNKNELDPFGMSAEEIIARVMEGTSHPVSYGFPSGHVDDNRPLILGRKARLTVTDRETRLEYL